MARRLRGGIISAPGAAAVLLSAQVLSAERNESEVAAGEKLFAACAACHVADLPTRTGPDLRGVVGRKAGTMPGFRYSRALKNSGATWDDATLDAFLAEPQASFPGNAMPFPGLPDARQRRDLIAYLKTLK